ncbi:MAG: arginine--tRNA ligase [Pseudonocardiaceae bacterium]|nr:arginine--tRNA ligase [Pseudonocardiaceae bacterium]
MNKLHALNEERLREAEAHLDATRRKHAAARPPALTGYPLPHLKERITTALSDSWGQGRLQVQFDIIERQGFGGDIALKFPQLLGNGGPRAFASDHLPWIASRLSESDFEDVIERVDKAGMYVNLTLADTWFRTGARALVGHGDDFGRNDSLSGATIVVDYSSPNVAKSLHAGHIRSTIVGHVLSNLYEAAGALVYRVNHVNDFGGFGFVLEGWRRFGTSFPTEFSDNDKLLEVYRVRRTAERVLASECTWDDVSAQDRELLSRYFPDVNGLDTFRASFNDFTSHANERFARLEAGDEDEVDLWAQLVMVSLRDFDSFYDALNIRFDFVLGESFYYEAGDTVVEACLASGQAKVFTEADVAAEVERLDGELAAGKITTGEYRTFIASAEKDTGAVVVPLDDGVRFIVRRSDGRSIYATRDLGAVQLRREVFGATDMIYVVGQEAYS